MTAHIRAVLALAQATETQAHDTTTESETP